MNDDISKQLHLAAQDNWQAAMAIKALERAQEDANRANEALKSAQDEAKAAQHAAEQSLAELKAMTDAKQNPCVMRSAAPLTANAAAPLTANVAACSAELPFVIVVDGLPYVNISGPSALSAEYKRIGVGDIAELAKQAQRDLNTPIVGKPKAE